MRKPIIREILESTPMPAANLLKIVSMAHDVAIIEDDKWQKGKCVAYIHWIDTYGDSLTSLRYSYNVEVIMSALQCYEQLHVGFCETKLGDCNDRDRQLTLRVIGLSEIECNELFAGIKPRGKFSDLLDEDLEDIPEAYQQIAKQMEGLGDA